MNILFFLHPKQEVAYVYDDCTLRQVLETMEHHKYASIPMLNRQGEYVGTITEGDLLWGMKKYTNLNLKDHALCICPAVKKLDILFKPVLVLFH